MFFEHQTADALAAAILAFEAMDFDEATIRDNARRFAPERFREQIAAFLREVALPSTCGAHR